jgi:hypothetical protein
MLRALQVLQNAGALARSGAARRAAALVLALLACPASVAQADIAHPGAKEPGPDRATIRDPTDADWFVLPGIPPRGGTETVNFRTVDVPVTCMAAAPLNVGLYSPEGHFIRRVDPGRDGVYRRRAPVYPGRYLLKVTATDPTCTPLEYVVADFVEQNGYTGGYNAHADLCAGLDGNVRAARRRLKRMRARARAVSRSARPRYRTLVRRREHQLAAARAAYVKHKCTTPT